MNRGRLIVGRDKSLIAFVKKKIERLCNINVTGHGLVCGYQSQHGFNIIELNSGIIVMFFQILSQLVRRQRKAFSNSLCFQLAEF